LQTVAEKTAKNFRGSLFAAPCTLSSSQEISALCYQICRVWLLTESVFPS